MTRMKPIYGAETELLIHPRHPFDPQSKTGVGLWKRRRNDLVVFEPK